MIDKKVNRKALARARQRASDRLDKVIQGGDLREVRNEIIECSAAGYELHEGQDAEIKVLEKAERDRLLAGKKKGKRNA
jgi:hypothetical protein